jgi:4-amino-4-deoxy-L-arabinose transferase-like glycosyltransferase
MASRQPATIGIARERVAGDRATGLWAGALSALRRDPVLALLVPALLALGLWHLERYPRSWFDEGMYLQVAKNFAREGLYAVRSADGTIDYAPIIGVGPTVLMPAALAVALGGASLAAARLVGIAALLIATILLYLIARGLFGRLAGACTVLLLLCLPAID